jgi:site-specific DNA recombinase
MPRMAKPVPSSKVRTTTRCAIYTRKSSEEGLDQDFNSLDAQREACAAYVTSQRHEGWTLVSGDYDDGGISGGHMNRPGLLRLLDDIKADKVDVIVVYKVDRLTRALSDFARIVEILDNAGASFVSITQSFNTTTSMGRLTLNVLLSFAQFEREVTGERIRDKIAASKKKGMWMGGTVPLGYDVVDRKLIVNTVEATTVRMIMTRYTELGSVPALTSELRHDGIYSKRRTMADGRKVGGAPITRGALYAMLTNRIYLGEISHKGASYPGEQVPIIDQGLWDTVQDRLGQNRVTRRHQGNASDPSLLAGMIRDGEGRRMSPRHVGKASFRYRYYVSVDDTISGKAGHPAARISAGEVEAAVLEGITALLKDGAGIIDALNLGGGDAAAMALACDRAGEVAAKMPSLTPSAVRDMLQSIGLQIIVKGAIVTASASRAALSAHLGIMISVDQSDEQTPDSCAIPIARSLAQTGHEMRLTIAPRSSGAPTVRDGNLVALIAKAHRAREILLGEQGADAGDSISHRHLIRLARLSYFAPDIIQAILEGRQPRTMTSRSLLRISEIPLNWDAQRIMLGV